MARSLASCSAAYGRFNALVGIGDHQLDTAQTTSSELVQQLSPEGLGLGRSDIHAEHFAAAIAVDADRSFPKAYEGS